jgi:cytidylate kinase
VHWPIGHSNTTERGSKSRTFISFAKAWGFSTDSLGEVNMRVPVLIFSVQIGSGGFVVARAVANALRYLYYDWHITSEAVGLATIPRQGLADRILSRLVASAVLEEELPSSMISPSPELQEEALRVLLNPENRGQIEDVIRQVASRGDAVIVGHGAQAVLREWNGVLKVLVIESRSKRAAYLAKEQGCSLLVATRMVEQLDQLKQEFLQSVYGIDRLDPSLYDLTLNLEHTDWTTAINTVVEAAESYEPAREDEPTKRSSVWLSHLHEDNVA